MHNVNETEIESSSRVPHSRRLCGATDAVVSDEDFESVLNFLFRGRALVFQEPLVCADRVLEPQSRLLFCRGSAALTTFSRSFFGKSVSHLLRFELVCHRGRCVSADMQIMSCLFFRVLSCGNERHASCQLLEEKKEMKNGDSSFFFSFLVFPVPN